MQHEKMTEVAAALREWEFLRQLPREIDGFQLAPGNGISGRELHIAAYVNAPMHSRVDLVYTAETFDYVPVKTIGLHSFRDERFFCRDRERFAALMLEHLPDIIAEVDRQHSHKFGYATEGMHFAAWEYWKKLPRQIGSYELFLTPENPVNYINGSVLFLDYTDFSRGNQLFFLYNVFRDELFAEKKKANLPLTTEQFNAHTLQELEKLLDAHLEEALCELAK